MPIDFLLRLFLRCSVCSFHTLFSPQKKKSRGERYTAAWVTKTREGGAKDAGGRRKIFLDVSIRSPTFPFISLVSLPSNSQLFPVISLLSPPK